MGKTNGSRGAWVFRMFLITFLAAVIALTGQSQALGDGSSIEFVDSWGTEGGAKGQFRVPVGVAVGPIDDNGKVYVYVADTNNNRIVKLDPDGELDLKWGTDGMVTGPDAPFGSAVGIAVGDDHSVYVADAQNNRIVKLNSKGKLDLGWGYKGMSAGPGARLLEVTEGLTFADTLFSLPFGVAVGSNGSIYVADTGNNRIVKLNPDGVLDINWGPAIPKTGMVTYMVTPTFQKSAFSEPTGVAVGDDHSIYVADKGNNRIVKLNPDGVLDHGWGNGWGTNGMVTAPGGDAWGTNSPTRVAVGSNGSIYVADMGNHRIVKLDPKGELDLGWGDKGIVTGPGTDAKLEGPLEVDPLGVDHPGAEYLPGFVLLPADPGASGVRTAAQFNNPADVAVGDDHSIYVADSLNHRIVKFTEGNGSGGDCSDNAAFKAMIEEKGFGVDFGALIDCVALNQESLVDPGQLVSVKIEPQGRAGSSENVKISFTTKNPVLEEGQVVVTLPEGFGVGDNTEVTLEVDGGSVSVDSSTDARSVTAVFRTPIKAGDDVVLILSDIKHPEVSGKPTEGGGVETQSLAADPIDSCLPWNDGCTIEYTDVKPGALTALVFDLKAGELNRVGNLSHTAAGSTGEVFVSFRTTNPVPADGKVVVTFPKGFEVGTGIDVMGFEVGLDEDSDYWKAVKCEGGCPSGSRSVTITVGEGIGAGELVRLKLSDIKNPEVTSGVNGEPQDGGIVTYNTAEVVIDGACEAMLEGSDIVNGSWPQGIDCASGQVTVDPITPGKLGVSEDGIKLGNEKAGGTGDVTVTFTLDNPLPANGAIAVTFPKGFVLNSGDATEATLLKPDGGTVDRVTVIEHTSDERTTALIRLKSLSIPLNENDEVQVKLTNIRNPQVSGQTQNFEIRTSVGK